jgi:hypothetical protein
MSLYAPERVRHTFFYHRFLSLCFAYLKFEFQKFLQAPNELWKEVLNFLCVTQCMCDTSPVLPVQAEMKTRVMCHVTLV